MDLLWTPSEDRIARARLTAFMRDVGQSHGCRFRTYQDLYRFSIEEPAEFWRAVWEFCGIRGEEMADVGLAMGHGAASSVLVADGIGIVVGVYRKL